MTRRRSARQLPVEVGLQTETGYPHKGKLDYVAPTVNQSTGTLAVRAVLDNADRRAAAGLFRARARAARAGAERAARARHARSAATRAGATCWSSTTTTWSSSARSRSARSVGELRVIESGLKADDRVVVGGLLRAIPGQKVDPQTADARRSARRTAARHDLEILHRAAGPRQRDRDPDGRDRRRRAVQAAGRAVSRRRAADRAGHHALSRRQRRAPSIDTVALPIEQQVNGVEDMIYMQSYSARRRHLHADRDLQDRHRPQLRAGPGAEPRVERARRAAAGGAGAGRHRPEAVDRDPADRHADLARRPLRQPVS